MTNQMSFIDATLTRMAEGAGRNAAIARLVQSQPSKDPAHRIAYTYALLRSRAAEAVEQGREPDIKAGCVLSFIQQVQNNNEWGSRRLEQAQKANEEGNQAWGMDFSQDIAEDMSVECVATENIAKVVDDDFRTLLNVHTWVAAQMNIVVDDFAYFRQQQVIDGVWSTKYEAHSHDEAKEVMVQVIADMQEASASKLFEEALSIDFSQSNKPDARDNLEERPLTAA